jgi:hypothetical protein
MFKDPILKVHEKIIGVALFLCVLHHFSLHRSSPAMTERAAYVAMRI